MINIITFIWYIFALLYKFKQIRVTFTSIISMFDFCYFLIIYTFNKMPKYPKLMPKRHTKVWLDVRCECKLCNGKTVKITTRIKYEKKEQWLQDSIYRLMKSKGKDKKKDDPVPVRFPILVSDEIQFNSDDSSQNLHDKAVMIDNDHDQFDKEIFIRKSVDIRKKRRRYDQFHKTNNIILSEKYEK